MKDPRISNLAKILVHYSADVKENEKVMIRGFPLHPTAAPLIAEIYREVLKAGGLPHVSVDIEGVDNILLKEASDHQLQQPNLVEKLVAEEFNVDFRIGCDTNTRSFSNVKPEKWQLYEQGYAEVEKTWWKRESAGEIRFVVSRYPTNAYAQDADMSLDEFSDFFFRSAFADLDDPLSEWKRMQEEQERLTRWLVGKKQVQIKGDGIDLSMSIADRTFVSCHGTANVPDGEIFTSPVEDSVNGVVRYSFPAIRRGVEINGAELTFEDGKVVKARAESNEEHPLKTLEIEGANRLGELGIGTNKQIDIFTKNMLFDEKIGGTIHLALGKGFPEAGGKNQSVIHWDMLCDMRSGGQILVDGELIYDSGEFKI